jgi:hypothetical protein
MDGNATSAYQLFGQFRHLATSSVKARKSDVTDVLIEDVKNPSRMETTTSIYSVVSASRLPALL